jgi:uncharacterized membrane protein YdjX (TVP38/TMEM64 family)
MTRAGRQNFAAGVFALAVGVIGAAVAMRAGGMSRAMSQVEAGLALARQFETASWLSLVLAQLLAVMVGVLPASLVGMAAGAIFGVGRGFAISSASVLVGAFSAFVLSRSLFRRVIERAMAGRIAARNFDVAVGREGWRLVLLLRASPLMPFAATSYVLGLSAVTLRDYMFGTLAALPALFGYVALGALAEKGLDASTRMTGQLQWALLIVGFAATALAVLHVGTLLGRALRSGVKPIGVAAISRAPDHGTIVNE